jgi:transforming growth factor-beta-induced protein
MRKITILFVALSVLALSLVPAFAQDEATQTIAEIVVASATSDTPEFTTLLTAIEAADPAVLEALSSNEEIFTVFAPTDAAFATLFDALGEEAVADLLADPEALTEILLFHVHNGSSISAEQISQVFNVFGTDITLPLNTMNGQSIDLTYDETQGVMVNGALLVTTDVMATNGIIHVIDVVILPESRDIVTIFNSFSSQQPPQFSNLYGAIYAAELAETLSDPEAMYTVFAPIDSAFASLDADTMALVGADLVGTLTYHVVEGIVSTAALNDIFFNLGTEGYEAPAWFVGYDETTNAMEILTVNGQTIVITSTSIIDGTVNDANIVQLDVDASNGVIHIIDGVLVPSTGE